MNLFCYADNRMKDTCETGDDGICVNLAADAAETREFTKVIPFIYMKGGTTELARLMDHTRDFDRGMHEYREAVRNGEQPDTTVLGSVEKNRRKQESIERGRAKLNTMLERAS